MAVLGEGGLFLMIEDPLNRKRGGIVDGAGRGMRGRKARKVDVRLPEKGNSNFHGARPVHVLIAMI
jgi:hypothetical protein